MSNDREAVLKSHNCEVCGWLITPLIFPEDPLLINEDIKWCKHCGTVHVEWGEPRTQEPDLIRMLKRFLLTLSPELRREAIKHGLVQACSKPGDFQQEMLGIATANLTP